MTTEEFIKYWDKRIIEIVREIAVMKWKYHLQEEKK